MKKLLCTILAAAMLSPCAAYAREWVHVSEWAYNDVSVFTSEGLLTERFDSISDYRRNITRAEFAELLCSVLIKTDTVSTDFIPEGGYSYFEDIGDNYYLRVLIVSGIVQGDIIETETDPNGDEHPTRALFHPDDTITREDAAVLVHRALNYRSANYTSADESYPLDYSDTDDISDYALNAVASMTENGLISGMNDGSFSPKSNITIEQAITMLYRVYRSLPTAPEADGAHIDAQTETTVQTYSNGYTETKLGNTLYVKKDDISMPFDTDIYSNLFCTTANDGNTYVAAQNYNKLTDIFNIQTGELLYTIPYTVYKAEPDYIYTKSKNAGPMTFGLYDYSNKEILPPQYSLDEIETLKSNGFTEPQDSYQAADGWIYYADWADGGHMYRVDSNGDNKQKISDEDCYNINFLNGWIFYHIRGEEEGKLFCMKPDGSCAQRVADFDIYNLYYDFGLYADGTPIDKDDPNIKPYMFATKYTDSYKTETGRYYHQAELYKIWFEGDTIRCEKVFDDYIRDIDMLRGNKGEKSWIYFTKTDEYKANDGKSRLYRTDGDIVECVNENEYIENFSLVPLFGGGYAFEIFGDYSEIDENHGEYQTDYLADLELNYIEEFNYEAYSLITGTDESKYTDVDENTVRLNYLSDDEYSIYERSGYEESTDTYYYELYAADAQGNKRTILNEHCIIAARGGNIVYIIDDDWQTLTAFDLDTGNKSIVQDKIMRSNYNTNDTLVDSKGLYGFADRNSNINYLDIKDGTTKEVYPNKGFKKYGKPIQFFSANRSLVKIDEDGNYYDIVKDCNARYGIYVKNEDMSVTDISQYSAQIEVIVGRPYYTIGQ